MVGAVARGIGGPEERHCGCSESNRKVQRAGVATHVELFPSRGRRGAVSGVRKQTTYAFVFWRMRDDTPEIAGSSDQRRRNCKVSQVPADRVAEAVRTSKMAIGITNAIQNNPTTASAIQTQPVAKPAALSQKATQTQAPSKTSAATDTVQISNAAVAALKEATETPVQTAREAQSGDRQAQRLLAKETAAK
jgi:hypothetical protein